MARLAVNPSADRAKFFSMIVQISQFTPQPAIQAPTGAVITRRSWYSNSFIAGDNVTPVLGNNSAGQRGPYYEDTCSVNGSGYVVCPALDVQATTDSNPSATLTMQLYIDGAPSLVLMPNTGASGGWQIPSLYGAVVSFDQIATYNAAVQLLFPPNTYPTFAQMILEIQRLAGNFAYAAVGVNGIGQPSVAPDVASEPIFFGVNDPAVGDLHGALTQFRVPRADGEKELVDGLAVDDGTNFNIQTLGQVGFGDLDPDTSGGNGTFASVNDSITSDGGRASLQAGGSDQVEYAGVSADCSTGDGEINLQTTGITNLYGVNQVTIIGDGRNEQQGTQVVVNDPSRMVVQTVANQIPNDPSINSEQACFYLDQADSKLKVRVRLNDGSYLTGEIVLA